MNNIYVKVGEANARVEETYLPALFQSIRPPESCKECLFVMRAGDLAFCDLLAVDLEDISSPREALKSFERHEKCTALAWRTFLAEELRAIGVFWY